MKNDNDLIHFVTQYHRLHRQGAHLNDIFLRAFTGNQKMCRDTLLVSCPHLSVWGLFRLKKKLELVPCSGLQTTFSTLGYTSPICQGKRGGGGRDTPCGLYGEAPPERGAFLRLQVYERVGKFVISLFEGP